MSQSSFKQLPAHIISLALWAVAVVPLSVASCGAEPEPLLLQVNPVSIIGDESRLSLDVSLVAAMQRPVAVSGRLRVEIRDTPAAEEQGGPVACAAEQFITRSEFAGRETQDFHAELHFTPPCPTPPTGDSYRTMAISFASIGRPTLSTNTRPPAGLLGGHDRVAATAAAKHLREDEAARAEKHRTEAARIAEAERHEVEKQKEEQARRERRQRAKHRKQVDASTSRPPKISSIGKFDIPSVTHYCPTHAPVRCGNKGCCPSGTECCEGGCCRWVIRRY